MFVLSKCRRVEGVKACLHQICKKGLRQTLANVPLQGLRLPGPQSPLLAPAATVSFMVSLPTLFL